MDKLKSWAPWFSMQVERRRAMDRVVELCMANWRAENPNG